MNVVLTQEQKILVLTHDLEIRDLILPALGKEIKPILVESPQDAISKLDDSNFGAVIIDAKTTQGKTHYFEDKEIISYLEIVQYANQLNPNIPIIILVNSILSKDGTFAAKCGATLIMDRKDISINRMVYVLKVLRKRTFRTVLSRDLIPGSTYPVDLYHYLPANKRYLPFLKEGITYSPEKETTLRTSGTRHLYVKEDDLKTLLGALKGKKEVIFSEQLAQVHNRFRKLLTDFFNVSTDGAIHFGKLMMEDGMTIIDQLENLIDQYPNIKTCLTELPFPRYSILAHGINSAIYTIIFARACEMNSAKEMAFAALIHNVGISEVDFNLLKKKETELSPEEFSEYKTHVQKTLEIIQRKKLLISPLMEAVIMQHHEHFDGSGFPAGLSGVQISPEAALLSIVGSFNHLTTVHPGEKSRTIFEAWAKVKEHSTTTIFKKKFHPDLMSRLDLYFEQLQTL